MDQSVIQDALTATLGGIESFVTTALFLSAAVFWPAIRNQDAIEVLSLKLERRHAYPVVASIYVIVAVAVLILFLRLIFLVNLLDGSPESKKALDAVVTHSWILNPYSYFGPSLLAVLYSSSTYGLLIVVWWIMFASLHAVADVPKRPYQQRLEHVFLSVGLAAMLAMGGAGFAMLQHAEYPGVHSVMFGKGVMSFVSIGIGSLIFTLCDRLKAKNRNVAVELSAARPPA